MVAKHRRVTGDRFAARRRNAAFETKQRRPGRHVPPGAVERVAQLRG
jgi:hypothetical protein